MQFLVLDFSPLACVFNFCKLFSLGSSNCSFHDVFGFLLLLGFFVVVVCLFVLGEGFAAVS